MARFPKSSFLLLAPALLLLALLGLALSLEYARPTAGHLPRPLVRHIPMVRKHPGPLHPRKHVGRPHHTS
ncbi:hypothetical protein HER32_19785 [Hymenobacter sp. BT18]|uniref:hypothetical protein n=1 Tax=Hymenobacter sp. BT18 TaxID=2835648 RepID=UPI00143E79DC|nr:hypothetical protein [Hymenobacter sp. BT18]QIX63291.1 hypothetical protein HER32_19785 [Hymenobacter sp. BT18]